MNDTCTAYNPLNAGEPMGRNIATKLGIILRINEDIYNRLADYLNNESFCINFGTSTEERALQFHSVCDKLCDTTTLGILALLDGSIPAHGITTNENRAFILERMGLSTEI